MRAVFWSFLFVDVWSIFFWFSWENCNFMAVMQIRRNVQISAVLLLSGVLNILWVSNIHRIHRSLVVAFRLFGGVIPRFYGILQEFVARFFTIIQFWILLRVSVCALNLTARWRAHILKHYSRCRCWLFCFYWLVSFGN